MNVLRVTESTALNPLCGEVAEWSNVPDSKSVLHLVSMRFDTDALLCYIL